MGSPGSARIINKAALGVFGFLTNEAPATPGRPWEQPYRLIRAVVTGILTGFGPTYAQDRLTRLDTGRRASCPERLVPSQALRDK